MSGKLPLEGFKMPDANIFVLKKTNRSGTQTSNVYDFRRPKYLSGILG